MACYKGLNGVVTVGGSAVAQIRSYTITESADTADCTTMGDTHRTHMATIKSWEGSLDLVWDKQDDTAGLEVGGAEVALIVYPEGTGDNMAGQIIVTSLEVSAAYEDVITASVSFTGTGPLTRTYA